MPSISEPVTPGARLKRCGAGQHQSRWILAACRDRRVDLATASLDASGRVHVQDTRRNITYSQVWSIISEMVEDRHKVWVAGWRMRWLLEQTRWLHLLERGALRLPQGRRSDAEPTRHGRLVVGVNCLEVDLCVDHAQVKVIDFDNWGLCPVDLGHHLQRVRIEDTIEAFRGLVRVYELTGMRLHKTSAAQVGWAHFRAHHSPPLCMFHERAEVRALERRAYFGGRCEARRLGVQPFTCYSVDVRGCYAHVCATQTMPAWCDAYWPGEVPINKIDPEGADHWIADCVVKTDQPLYPLRDGDLPIFPVGRFWTSLTWPELRLALRRGHVERITSAARYWSYPVFASFAEWYQVMRRKVGNTRYADYDQVLKCAFNAGIGFAARQGREWKLWDTHIGLKWFVGITEPPDGHAEICSCHILDGHAEYLSIGAEPRHASPALHATISAYARVRLAEIAQQIGWHTVIYWDTDGLIIDEEGYDRLTSTPEMWGSAPGQLRERFPPAQAIIRGQKCYEVGKFRVHAGLASREKTRWGQFVPCETPTGQVMPDWRVKPWEYDVLYQSVHAAKSERNPSGIRNQRLV